MSRAERLPRLLLLTVGACLTTWVNRERRRSSRVVETHSASLPISLDAERLLGEIKGVREAPAFILAWIELGQRAE